MSVGNLGGDSNSQDIDLNIAPIIDSFVVLIAFMLLSAAFLAIGIFDAGLSAGGAAATSQTPPPVRVVVELRGDHSFQIQVTGKENTTAVVKPLANEWNLTELTQHLARIKSKWKETNAVTLQAQDNVSYKEIVRAMEESRKTLPAVLLGGF